MIKEINRAVPFLFTKKKKKAINKLASRALPGWIGLIEQGNKNGQTVRKGGNPQI